MAIRICKGYTAGTRTAIFPSFEEITHTSPEKTLIGKNTRKKGSKSSFKCWWQK